jgi:hypothetical protein
MHFEPVNAPATTQDAPEKNIFRHAEFLDQGKLLRDHRDARRLCVADRMKRDRLTVDEQFALVAAVRMNAGEQFDQRGFSSSILTAEGVDLSRS